MFKTPAELCDVVSLLVLCGDDSTVLLLQEENAPDYWIPSAKVNVDGWVVGARKLAKEVLQLDINNERAFKFYRLWLPNQFIHHVVFKIMVTGDLKRRNRPLATKNKARLVWVTIPDLSKSMYLANLKSPELLDFVTTAILKNIPETKSAISHPEGSWQDVVGYDAINSLVEVLEKHVIVTKTTGVSSFEGLIDAVGFRRADQGELFRLFLMFTFPCMYMNKTIFGLVLTKLGLSKNNLNDFFRAADIYNRNTLSFREFIRFLAILDPKSPHTGPSAEIRFHFIFRFFNRNDSTRMEYSDFKSIIQTIRRSKNQPIEPGAVTKDAETSIREMGMQPESPIQITDFINNATKLRGASALLRASKNILTLLDIDVTSPKDPDVAVKLPVVNVASDRMSTKVSVTTKVGDYDLAAHSIRLKKTGIIIDTEQLWNIDQIASTSCNFNVTSTHEQAVRVKSLDSFFEKSVSNELLRGLQYFAQPVTQAEAAAKPGRRPKEAFSWGTVDPTGFANCLLKVCDRAIEILKTDTRLIEINSPVYILGDLHGNFPDLIYFEKILWHLGPSLSPVNLLFLGDYVDRGPHSVEVISYLFAYKVQSPKKIFLLRGNHEIRDVQLNFTFLNECNYKFGATLGPKVWNACNDVFDVLPLAAVIDRKVFCCHGGIPPPWLCPVASAINSIPCPLPKPDVSSPLAWEIMWNDPVRLPKVTQAVQLELLANEGFATNSKRGTGHVFTAEALNRFLQANGYTHIVRAHEVQKCGFYVQQKTKLVTVFSSSHYCGGSNEAACVLADGQKLRMFRLDTS